MAIPRYFLSDFVEIQRKSFFELLEKGLIEEFTKRNPIKNSKKNLEIFFYPEYYKLTIPENSPRNAILKSKSYTSKLYIPVQLTDKTSKVSKLKWVCIGNLPLMTKRGHFILNGAPRVVVNQILRSPGIYYQKKIYEKFRTKWDYKPETSYKRYYADLICQRGTWLRIEMDKDKCLWAQMKKGPKIPLFWFLIAMGLTEKIIFNTVAEPTRLVSNLEKINPEKNNKEIYNYVKNPPEAWSEIYSLVTSSGAAAKKENSSKKFRGLSTSSSSKAANFKGGNWIIKYPQNQINITPVYSLFKKNNKFQTKILNAHQKGTNQIAGTLGKPASLEAKTGTAYKTLILQESGRKWLFNKFMNSRNYDLGKLGRMNFNKKLGISISPTNCTLTPQDLLYATDYLIKVDQGIKKIDDIDHLKNRRVRTSGEIIQIQIGIGLMRLEKEIRENLNKNTLDGYLQFKQKPNPKKSSGILEKHRRSPTGIASTPEGSNQKAKSIEAPKSKVVKGKTSIPLGIASTSQGSPIKGKVSDVAKKQTASFNGERRKMLQKFSINQFITTKGFNSALREFFGSSPLSQFMDQINPLSELTHKRRLSSMGPGGVTRDSATLAIRGIHPTHYGRICPVETPEGKNTGLVNSLTAFARVNTHGFLQSPFYKVYKGQVQKKIGMFFLSAEQEEKIKLAAADISISPAGFLPKSNIPVRIAEDFTKIPRTSVEYIGVSALQMISIATSLIPFLEHDDANRALMGSNMQRQAVPLIRPERPIVGTGLEARAVSDSGHVLQTKTSGYVHYSSGNKIIIYSFNFA